MGSDRFVEARQHLRDAVAEFADVLGSDVADGDLIEAVRFGHSVERELQLVGVRAVADLDRRGVFARYGQRPVTALADLLGVERVEARRMVTAAEQAVPRVDLLGQVLPARLPATAAAFAAGTAGVRHVDVIAGLLSGPVAQRVQAGSGEVWAGAEEQLAAHAGDYTPSQLREWGRSLLEMLDEDGPEPDEQELAPINDLQLCPNRGGSGGRIVGRFDDAALYDVIAALIDAKSAPLTGEDRRPVGQRQAEAMAEIFGWVADHGDTSVVPSAGGRRPQVNVLVRLEDLQNRARAACLDFGGTLSPGALRWLCCDACVVPVVLGDLPRVFRTA